MAGRVINSVTGGQHWVLHMQDAKSLRAPLARAVVSASIPSAPISEQFIESLVCGSSVRLMCLKMLFLMPRCWYFFVISFSLTLPEKGIPPVVFIV